MNSEYPPQVRSPVLCYRPHFIDTSEHYTVYTRRTGVLPAEIHQRCCLISFVTIITGNPPENTHSQNRTHLRLCCVFSSSLQCGAPCNVSIVQAIYKLRTCYTRRRLSLLFRMLANGR